MARKARKKIRARKAHKKLRPVRRVKKLGRVRRVKKLRRVLASTFVFPLERTRLRIMTKQQELGTWGYILLVWSQLIQIHLNTIL